MSVTVTRGDDGVFSISGTEEEITAIRDLAQNDWGDDDEFVTYMSDAIEQSAGATVTVEVPNDTIYDLGDVLAATDDEDTVKLGEEIHDKVAEASEQDTATG